ncbi:MAG: Na+/H+ antiporter NhaC family protein, partial [Bradymonadia bacterium]
MTVKRICLTLLVSILVLAGVRLIIVDQRILIDQASQNATKKITQTLGGLPLKMSAEDSGLRITGASPRTQRRVSQRFNDALKTSKKTISSTPIAQLKSNHLKFKTFANTHQLSSYHYWEFEPIVLANATDLNAALKQLGINHVSENTSLRLDGASDQHAGYRSAWIKIPRGIFKKGSLLARSKPLTVHITTNKTGASMTVGGMMNLSPPKTRLPGSEGLVPPLIALLIAIGFRRIIPALLIAVLSGAAIQQTEQPLGIFWDEISGVFVALFRMVGGEAAAPAGYIGPVLDDAFNLQILGFTFVLVGMISIVNKMGGTSGLVARLTRLVRGPKSAQAVTAMTGTALFFDDYANTVVVGTSGRSITDKFRISREKLAYIVDSTSAPVAGVALLSTWIGYEVGLFDDLLSHLPNDGTFPTNGYGLFLAALPYRFYCFYALMLVFIIAFTGRDFGPMLTAEARTRATGLVKNGDTGDEASPSALEKVGVPLRAMNAVVPIVTVLVSILFFVLSAAPEHTGSLLSIDGLRIAFGNGDLDLAHVLFKSALIGAGMCIVLASVQRLLTPKEITKAFVEGMSGLWGAACVLILAWSIKQVCDDLGTGTVILALMGDQITPEFVPVIIFCLSGLIGFSTGTSWGTMALMLPIAAPLSVEISGEPIIVLASLAAVLDGAIWGDHCSPISDTTVLSSAASD